MNKKDKINEKQLNIIKHIEIKEEIKNENLDIEIKKEKI